MVLILQADLVQVNTLPNQLAKEADKLARQKKWETPLSSSISLYI